MLILQQYIYIIQIGICKMLRTTVIQSTSWLTIVLLLLSGFVGRAQTIRYVDSASANTGTGGNSWATAGSDFQATINASNAGDQVWVKKGTYLPSAGTSFSMKEGVAIYGGFSGTETALAQRNFVVNKSILKGNGNRLFYNYYPPVTNSAVIDGFTITGGNSSNNTNADGGAMFNYQSSPTIANCIFSNNYAGNADGGAIYNFTSSPIISNCTFINNSVLNNNGRNGGAMHNEFSSAPIITNCTFSNNIASTGSGGAISSEFSSTPIINNCTFNNNRAVAGAAIYVNGAGPALNISNTTFKSNTASSSGGALYIGSSTSPTIYNCVFSYNTSLNGGAMFVASSSPAITNCNFNNNTANASSSYGGALYNSSCPSSLTISNCVFSYNAVSGSNTFGAGMYNLSSSPTIRNCIFSNNTATYTGAGAFGAAMCNSASSPSISNCTFTKNSATGTFGFGSGIYNYSSSSPTVVNSILYGDAGGEIYNSSGAATVTYSDVQGGYTGTGNINTNPLFFNDLNPIGPDSIWGTADDGLRPFICGPSVNVGNNAAVPITNTIDISGAPRIQQGIVDMGAYEGGYLNTTTWLGLTDAWAAASNWSNGNVPDACTHAIVNSGTPNMPLVTGNGICYKLTVNNGATLTCANGGHLQVIGK